MFNINKIKILVLFFLIFLSGCSAQNNNAEKDKYIEGYIYNISSSYDTFTFETTVTDTNIDGNIPENIFVYTDFNTITSLFIDEIKYGDLVRFEIDNNERINENSSIYSKKIDLKEKGSEILIMDKEGTIKDVERSSEGKKITITTEDYYKGGTEDISFEITEKTPIQNGTYFDIAKELKVLIHATKIYKSKIANATINSIELIDKNNTKKPSTVTIEGVIEKIKKIGTKEVHILMKNESENIEYLIVSHANTNILNGNLEDLIEGRNIKVKTSYLLVSKIKKGYAFEIKIT